MEMHEWLAAEWDELRCHIEDEYRSRKGIFAMATQKKPIYRWVEPESVWFDDDGKQHAIPEHQEQGEYLDESNIPGYIVVLWNGKKHLVKESDVVAILS